MDFILRIYNSSRNSTLEDIDEITISNITLLSKQSKLGGVCMHKNNQKKFGYSIELSKKFAKIAGSNSYPILAFKGEFIDIIVKNFPRYPSFGQSKFAARSCLNGYGYVNYFNKGFPNYLKYRTLKFLNINEERSKSD